VRREADSETTSGAQGKDRQTGDPGHGRIHLCRLGDGLCEGPELPFRKGLHGEGRKIADETPLERSRVLPWYGLSPVLQGEVVHQAPPEILT